MTARGVREAVIHSWEDLLRPHFGNRDAAILALELAVRAEGHGVRFTAPAHPDDPDADWTTPVQPAEPGDAYRDARERLGGKHADATQEASR